MNCQVDFYLIPAANQAGRIDFACRLIEKAYRRRHRLYAHCPDQTTSFQLDERLWTFQDMSFIPHNLCGEGPDSPPPIQIGFETPPQHRDILLNLCPESPTFSHEYQRCIEIIHQDQAAKAAARDRYRYYQQQGLSLKTHDLCSVTA